MTVQALRLRRGALSSAVMLALAFQLPQAYAQSGNEPATDEAKEVSSVVVTGSRIKRTQSEGPAPVTIISSEQIQREGFVTVSDVLETVTQASGSTQNELNSAGGFTPNASVINLRGLGPGRTLLLVNGRRAADYPFPYNGQSNFQNFNNIPAGAVDRIEILAGGASAIYGSDAVAGVVNVVLKTNYDGDTVKFRVGTSTRGGRDLGDLQWTGGKTGDQWSLTYSFEYYAVDPLFGFDRDFMDSVLDNPLPPALGGIQPSIGTQIRRTRPTTTYTQPSGRDCSAYGEWVPWTYTSSTTGATLGPGCGYYEYVAQQSITNRNRDGSAYLYGTWDFDNGMRGWASFQGYHSQSRLSGGLEQWFGGPQPNGQFYDPQFGTTILPIRAIMPSDYGGIEGTYQRFDETSYDIAAGLNGTIGDRFDWDFTLSHAEYQADRTRPRMVAALATEYFMGTQQGVTSGITGIPNGIPIYRLNLDRFYGRMTPEQYRSISTTVKYDAQSENTAASFVLSGDLFDLPAGPLSFATVLEATNQSYDLNTDERLLPTRREIYNLTGTGGGGERDRYALGIELSVPILESLRAQISGRYDKYDDITLVDDAFTKNFGLEWRPLDNLLIRGSYATSFKAPDMHYVFAEQSGGFSGIFDTYRCLSDGFSATQCGTSNARYSYTAFSVREGQPSLEEETGDSYTVGFVWDVTDNLSAQVDYYKIELDGTIADISSTFTLDAEAGCRTGLTRNRTPYQFAPDSAFCQSVLTRIDRINNPGAANDGQISEIRSGPINRAFLSTKGIDASVNYRFDGSDWGVFNTSLSWSHTLEQKTQEFSTDPVLSYRDDLTNFDFRSRVRGSVVWALDDWNAAVFVSRYGSLPNWQETGRIAPYFLWNINVGKSITDNQRVTLYVNNVFDNVHPRDDGFNSYPYFWRAYSPIGREVSLQWEYNF